MTRSDPKIRQFLSNPTMEKIRDVDAMPDGTYLTIADLCEAFQCRPRTIYDWRKKGFPSPVNLPGKALYSVKSIREYLNFQERQNLRDTRENLKVA